MKILYMGTGACEGVPNPYCSCPDCEYARKHGGRNIRSRTQALINDDLIIDMPADSFYHAQRFHLRYASIPNILITHSHEDHFIPQEFGNMKTDFAHLPIERPWNIYAPSSVITAVENMRSNYGPDLQKRITTHLVKPYTDFDVGSYHVYAVTANHDPHSTPVNYVIQKDGKTLLFAHDTGYFFEKTFTYFKKKKLRFDLVSLDCNHSFETGHHDNHMDLECCLQVRERLLKEGTADKKTIFVLNHFTHNSNGPLFSYDSMRKKAEPLGFIVSYDGLRIEF
jgi:phosphoribosyl 1,2-cyclic phosphate phosphodiesterase